MTRNSSTLSKVAVSLPPGLITGRIFAELIAEDARAQQPFARAHPVDVAAQGVDLAVVGDVAIRVGERPRRKRVGREALVHQRKRGFDQRVRQIGEHALDLRRRQHALVDERVRRQADDVERLARVRGQLQRLDFVLDALANDVERALERGRGPEQRAPVTATVSCGAVASMKTCSNAGATPAALTPTLPRLTGTARQPRTRCPSSRRDPLDQRLERQPRRLVGRGGTRARRRTNLPAATERTRPDAESGRASGPECPRRRRCRGPSRRRRDVRD